MGEDIIKRTFVQRCHWWFVLGLIIISSLGISSIALAQNQAGDASNTATIELSEPWDWLQLSSGEWLKGELLRMENLKVYFDSDDLGDLTIDWEDVVFIQTTRPMAVLRRDSSAATGPLRTRNEEIFIESENTSIAFNDVLNIASGSSNPSDLWSGDIGASTNIRQGNVSQKDINVTADFLRRTLKTNLRMAYLGNSSQLEGQQTANEHRATLNFDYRWSTNWFWRPLLAEYYRDPFQNIESQWTVGVGGGYYLAENYDLTWVISAGPAYLRTKYSTVSAGEPDQVSSESFFFVTQYDQELTSDIDLKMSYQLIVTDDESGRAKHHARLGLAVDLTDSLDLTVNTYWDRTSKPQVDELGGVPEKNDYRFAVGLSYEL